MRHWIKKWTTWEYLPWWLANVPVYGFYVWFALRARHLVFFSNVNPVIPLGGAMGESKWDILKRIPAAFVPATVFIQADTPFEKVLEQMAGAGLQFPVIAKPDVGERGFLIKMADTPEALSAHLAQFPVNFLLQELLTLPFEATVLFHRFPEGQFGVTSVCVKEFLSVTGDGKSTVATLMQRQTRSALQYERFSREQPELMARVPAPGEHLLLEPIGNHARGTKFINGNALIDHQLVDTFRAVCTSMDGILYGRFDLKSSSMEDLRAGKFQVMELNGVFGEPAHVYDPEFGMLRAYRDLYRHWNILYRLHKAQRKNGIEPASHAEAFKMVREYFRYKKELETRIFAKN